MTAGTASTVQQAAADIDAYISNNGGTYSAWYCGVASDPRTRLFNDHNVSEKGGAWMYRTVATDDDARRIEQFFLDKGCDGGGGGGDFSTRSVYAYKKTSYTRV